MTCWRIFILLFFIGFLPAQALAAPRIVELRADSGSGIDRIVLGFTQAVTPNIFTLDNPDRLVIDVAASQWEAGSTLPASYQGRLIRNVRFGLFNPETSRIVFDLNGPAKIQNSYVIPASGGYHFRFVVELQASGAIASAPAAPSAEPVPVKQTTGVIPPPKLKPRMMAQEQQKPLIVIDPGHGGVDPGAIGPKGTQEKHVTLRYAEALRKALLRTGRYRVVMTREDDRFILLRERVQVARKMRGDLFVSLHADSAPTPLARGLSVYTLSETASDKEAEAIAASENKADMVAGIDLSAESSDVANILIDLARRDTKNRSSQFADMIVEKVGKHVRLLPNTHRYAGFIVLKTLDIPSVLVELGFISHPQEERQLQTEEHMDKTVRGVVSSIDSFFGANPI